MPGRGEGRRRGPEPARASQVQPKAGPGESTAAASITWRLECSAVQALASPVLPKASLLCRNGFNLIQSQLLRSSFKLIISFTFSSLMFKNSDRDSERLDKFSEVLVEL